MPDHGRDDSQLLAVTLALLLLVGGVLLVDAWAGHWVSLAVFGTPIVAAYALRRTGTLRTRVRAAVLRRALRRMLRGHR